MEVITLLESFLVKDNLKVDHAIESMRLSSENKNSKRSNASWLQ